VDAVWLFTLSIAVLYWYELRSILTSSKQNGTVAFKKLKLVVPHGVKNFNHEPLKKEDHFSIHQYNISFFCIYAVIGITKY
jgi:hypothetical protein